jgi:hypothetical protein
MAETYKNRDNDLESAISDSAAHSKGFVKRVGQIV